jgi:hypothetical protein
VDVNLGGAELAYKARHAKRGETSAAHSLSEKPD